MNAKRILFWSCFLIILALIIWGLAVAMKRPTPGTILGEYGEITATDHVRGPSNAPVTLIEYSDFQCSACEYYYPMVARLLNESSTTVRFVFRHFPLSQHANAMSSSMAAEAAGARGKFWEMYDLIFGNHADWTELPDPTQKFVNYASELGLNADQFKNDTSSSTLRDKIQADQDGGVKIGINATPTFFVNGKVITNPSNYDQIKAIIDSAAKSSQ
jgi:protein-disulfide isomerase